MIKNKYSLKIKKFFNKYIDKKYKSNINFKKFNIINYFEKIFNNLEYTNDISIVKKILIKKIHDISDNSLLYVILNENNKFKSENDLFMWLRENPDKINLKDKMYSKYHDILFELNKNRMELHKMMYENIFISLDVINNSETVDLNYIVYKNDNTEIHLYNPIYNSDCCENFDIDLVMKIINFFRTLTKNNMFVKLVIFYGNQKKYLPINKIFCSDNINSGSTMKGEYINIYVDKHLTTLGDIIKKAKASLN
jgi:hypothetical protein